MTPLAEAEAVCNIARGAAAAKSDGDGAALSSSLTGAAAPDVAYYEGSMPLILAIPLGGSVLPKAAADGKMALPAGLEPDAGVQCLVDAMRVRWRELLCMYLCGLVRLRSTYVKPVLVQQYVLAGAVPRQQRGPPAHHRVQPLAGRRAGG
eukprot:COSAG01_NODE_14179_length_1486_cov_923.805335_2_plen_150_part_00